MNNDIDLSLIKPLIKKTWVISLPERDDRRKELEENWREEFPIPYEWIDGVRPSPEEIRWVEMKGLEAYADTEKIRGDYVVGAIGCKRAGIKAIKVFLESGAETGLICQDDCRWHPEAASIVAEGIKELPDDWDLLYFSSNGRSDFQPFSQHLIRLMGARLCTAILWKRKSAKYVLKELEKCDCEWDLLMQKVHPYLNTFCIIPMPAFQAESYSDIVRKVVRPSNDMYYGGPTLK